MALPVTSPNSKLSLTSPKRGQKREEGWKEVVRRSVLFLKAIYIECFKCLLARFIIHIFQLDDNLHRQQCWLPFNFILAVFFHSIMGFFMPLVCAIITIVMFCFLKIKETLCASIRGLSDHGERRLQHHSHPGRDRSSHWCRQTERQKRGEDDHHKVSPLVDDQRHCSCPCYCFIGT